MKINGANVLVTGASRGIGEALAREFAARGSNVCLVARSADALERIAAEIGGTSIAADLTDDAQVDGLFDQVSTKFGPVDILVNNAGYEGTGPFVHTDAATIRNVVKLNLETPIVLTRAFVPAMIARGRGHVVFTSSLAGSAGFPALTSYGATKAGLNNFTAALRLELGDTDIKTTLIAPGPVDTDMWTEVEEEPYAADTLKRLRRLQVLPQISPEKLARRSVSAIENNKRHVRHPRRLSLTFWLSEAPRRMTEGLLAGVRFPVD